MDTEAQHTERDPSSPADPQPDPASDDGSRSVRVSGAPEGPDPSPGPGTDAEPEADPDTGRGPSWRRTGLLGAVCVVFLLLLS
ncbi:hypothetical protein ACFTZM_24705, partial [Streptomyces hydrogenans]